MSSRTALGRRSVYTAASHPWFFGPGHSEEQGRAPAGPVVSVFPNRPTLHHPCWEKRRRARPNKLPDAYNRNGCICSNVRLHRRKQGEETGRGSAHPAANHGFGAQGTGRGADCVPLSGRSLPARHPGFDCTSYAVWPADAGPAVRDGSTDLAGHAGRQPYAACADQPDVSNRAGEAHFLTARVLTARENYVMPRRNSLPARDLWYCLNFLLP